MTAVGDKQSKTKEGETAPTAPFPEWLSYLNMEAEAPRPHTQAVHSSHQ